MVRHHDEAGAATPLPGELRVEHAQDDFLGSIDVEQAPAFIARESEKVRVPFLVVNPPSSHVGIVDQTGRQ
jgi:hypothetical protein